MNGSDRVLLPDVERPLGEQLRGRAHATLTSSGRADCDLAILHLWERRPWAAGSAIEAAVQGLAPGGRLLLVGEEFRRLSLWPEVPGLDAVIAAYGQAIADSGGDPGLGGRLEGMVQDQELSLRRSGGLFYATFAGDPEFGRVHRHMLRRLREWRDEILATGTVDAETYDATRIELERWGRRSDAALWYGASFAEARRRVSGFVTLLPA